MDGDIEDGGSSDKALSSIPELFYDLIAIVLPGYAVLIFLYFFVDDRIAIETPGGWVQGLGHIFIAYLVGHLLYSLSIETVAVAANRFYGSPRVSELLETQSAGSNHRRNLEPSFSPSFRDLLRKEITLKWGLAEADIDAQMFYELCRHYVAMRAPDRARVIRKEQAYGELSRSLVLVGLITGILSIFFALTPVIPTALSCLAAGFIAWRRYLQARKIDAFFVYLVFHIVRKSEEV